MFFIVKIDLLKVRIEFALFYTFLQTCFSFSEIPYFEPLCRALACLGFIYAGWPRVRFWSVCAVCVWLLPAYRSRSLGPQLGRNGFDFFSFIHFPEFSFSPAQNRIYLEIVFACYALFSFFFIVHFFFYYWLHLLLACVCLCFILIFSAQIVFVVSISVGVGGHPSTTHSLHRATTTFPNPFFLVCHFSLFFCSSLVGLFC